MPLRHSSKYAKFITVQQTGASLTILRIDTYQYHLNTRLTAGA